MGISRNRYDFMKEGTSVDKISQLSYPDPLSINYNKLKITQTPYAAKMSESDINMYLRKVNEIYGKVDYDDIILTLNGYPHRNFINTGDIIYFPKRSDLESSFSKKGV